MIVTEIVLAGSGVHSLKETLAPLGYSSVAVADIESIAGLFSPFGAVIVSQSLLSDMAPLTAVERLRLVTGDLPILVHVPNPQTLAPSLKESFALGTLEYLLDDEIEHGMLAGKLDRLFVGTQVDRALRTLQAGADEKRVLANELTLRKQVLDHERSVNNSIVNAITSAILIIDTDGIIMRTNEHTAAVPGLDKAALTGSQFERVLPAALATMTRRALGRLAAGRDSTARTWSTGRHHFEVSYYPMGQGGTSTALLMLIADITEQEQVTRQLYQAEKLATVGTLLSGIAHELRNPLAIISARAQRGLTKENPESDWTRRTFESVNKQADRCAALINNLLNFTRKTTAVMAIHRAEEVIDEALEYASYQRTFAQVEVLRQFEPALAIFGDRSRYVQVLLNLFTNATDAMQGKGVLSIRTYRAEPGMIGIAISDNGPGIAPEIADKVFDPFFTTKDTGSGTGLGLAITHQIVVESGGTISLESLPGSTTFTLKLPVTGPGNHERTAHTTG